MAIESRNPATGELLRHFDPFGEAAIEERIGLAAQAARDLYSVPLEHRALWMNRLAHLLEAEVEELGTTITQEMGKPITEARAEIRKCAVACRYYAEHAARIVAPEPIETEHNASFVRWEPLGVVLAIMPWNFPFWQVIRFAAPALMAGNTCLLKHAPNVPAAALAIESLIRRAGFPRGCLQVLLIEVEQVERVLSDERVAAATLTGSERAGRAVAAMAGSLIKPSVLELGGSDPFIVLPSAELAIAVSTAVRARTINSGQSCIAAKRFLIADAIYDEFTAAFSKGMAALRVGDPMDAETEIGSLSSGQQLRALERQIAAARNAGARISLGGTRLPGPGFFFPPTILEDVPPTSAIASQELFGPVAMVFRVSSLDEAITLANGTPFGLAASAWTRDPVEQQRLQRDLQCGSVFFNAMVASDPRLPFGGTRRSGYGRELSAAGMRAFMNAKTVVVGAPDRTVTAVPGRELKS